MRQHSSCRPQTLRLRRLADGSLSLADRPDRTTVARRNSRFKRNSRPDSQRFHQVNFMKKNILSLLLLGTFWYRGMAAAPVDLVDPTIGGQAFMLEPTRPTVSLPNSMVRVYPVRKDQLDDRIHSFPLSIVSHRLGELFWLMPSDGAADSWNQPQTYDQETLTPYYYATRFDDSLIRTEFTPTERCGYFRFTFPSGKPVILLANRRGGDLTAAGDNCISGMENITAESDMSAGTMHAYVYGEFSAPVKIQSSDSDKGKRLTITATGDQKELEFRYGISFISVEQAKKNLQKEIPAWSFDQVKNAAKKRWNEVLGQIHVA